MKFLVKPTPIRGQLEIVAFIRPAFTITKGPTFNLPKLSPRSTWIALQTVGFLGVTGFALFFIWWTIMLAFSL